MVLFCAQRLSPTSADMAVKEAVPLTEYAPEVPINCELVLVGNKLEDDDMLKSLYIEQIYIIFAKAKKPAKLAFYIEYCNFLTQISLIL